MQNNAPAPPPANVNANAQLPNQQQQYNSELEKRYNALAQKIAKDCGIKIQGKIDVDVLAKSTADFFAKKDAMQGSSKAFQELGKSWEDNVYMATNPDPLRLAMGGSLFAASKDDSIKFATNGLSEKTKREFCSIFKNINAKFEITGQQPNEFIKARREDVMKAIIMYRLRNPVCSKEDEKLYNKVWAAVQQKDASIINKNSTFGTITSVLSIGSTIGSTLIGFGVIASPVLSIALMAITALMLIPRVVSMCRSLTRLGYFDEAEKIKKSFDTFNGALQKDGKISENISQIMMDDYADKEQKSVELGQKFLDKVNVTAKQREKITGIVPPAKLNNQQQKAMNNAYNQNYPMKPVQQGRPGHSLDAYNKARCQCNNGRA